MGGGEYEVDGLCHLPKGRGVTGPLAYLDNFKGIEPPKRIWQAMLRELARRLPKVFDFGGAVGDDFAHPWKVSAGLWHDAPESYPAKPELLWRVDVASACINDLPVCMIYDRAHDARGWVMPDKYPAPKRGDFGYNPVLVDRPLTEKTDPPFLVVQAPGAGQPVAQWKDFVPVADSIRPDFFKTEEMWSKTLMRAFVIASTDPAVAQQYEPRLPPALKRFRVFAGKRPLRVTEEGGGFVEIARLYLTRDPDNDPANDQLYVEQLVFWDLMAMILQPSQGLFEVADLFQGLGVLGQIDANELQQTLSDTAAFTYWTT